MPSLARARVAATALAFAAASCARAPAPVAPSPPPSAEVRRIAPLTAGDAASAVIAGTHADGSSTVMPLTATPRVAVLAVAGGPGSALAVSAAIATGPGDIVHDGSLADPAWAAAVWTAAQATAAVLGLELDAMRFAAQARGRVDLAAAPAAIAAGFLASIVDVRTPAKPVGASILPDGTLGPSARGRGAGRAARDLEDAFAALTGHRLPRPIAAPAAAMLLAADERAAVVARQAPWRARLADTWSRLLDLESQGPSPEPIGHLLRDALAAGRDAERLQRDDQPAPATARLADAWVDAFTATTTADVALAVAGGDLADAHQRLRQAEATVDAMPSALSALAALVPATVPEQLRALAAVERALHARGARRLAAHRLAEVHLAIDALADRTDRASREVQGPLVALAAPAVLALADAGAAAAEADDLLALTAAPAPVFPLSPAALRRSAATLVVAGRAFRAAAGTADAAGAAGLSLDDDAGLSPDDAARLISPAGQPALAALAALAAADAANLDAWTALAVHDLALAPAPAPAPAGGAHATPLAATLATDGRAADALLARLLAASERRARERATAARVATGAIPAPARLAYQHARGRAAGDRADRIAALACYWRATRWSELAILLVRHGAPPAPPVPITPVPRTPAPLTPAPVSP